MRPAIWQVALLSAAILASAAQAASSSKKRTPTKTGENYMWVDENGQRHYGDALPGDAQGEKRVLNKQGVEVRRVTPKSAAQLAEEKRVADELKEREQHDRFLLATYTSTKDIERLRDERLVQIDAQIKASSAYIDSLDARMKTLQERAMRFKPYNTAPDARRMPDDLTEELVRGANEGRTQRVALENRRKELVNVRARFGSDIERYKELNQQARVPLAAASRPGG